MGKHYSQKDNLISIMTEISKKTPRGIMNGDTQIGHITWQMYLMRDYLKLDGTPLANASNDYSDLLSFAQDNNLITADTTDNSLFKYDSTTDVLTLPNYIDLVLQGGNTVEEKEAGLPNIKGSFGTAVPRSPTAGGTSTTGAITSDVGAPVNTFTGSGVLATGFDASIYNPIYSDTVNTVQPPAITLIPQIKYRKSTTMYEQIDAIVNYSTTEKVVGTWIDGKPLYQKTYDVNIIIDGSDHNIVAIPNNIDFVQNISGVFKFVGANNTIGFVPINCAYNSSAYMVSVDIWNGYIRNHSPSASEGWLGTWPAKITIQYTKTTD